jgi:hypothetical protein
MKKTVAKTATKTTANTDSQDSARNPPGFSNHAHGISSASPNISVGPVQPNVYPTPVYKQPVYTWSDSIPAADPRMDKLADRLGVEAKEASDPANGLHIRGEKGYYGVLDLFVAMAEFMDRFRLCPGCGEAGEIAAGDYLCAACRG